MKLLLASLLVLFQEEAPVTTARFQVRGKVTGIPAGAPSGLFFATLVPLNPPGNGPLRAGIQSDGTKQEFATMARLRSPMSPGIVHCAMPARARPAPDVVRTASDVARWSGRPNRVVLRAMP